jgi:pyridoxine 5-phosphate synthase
VSDEAAKTKLSVNLNKIALVRNARDNGIPNVLGAAKTSIAAGAHGITVHPRPDQRHIRDSDVFELAELLASTPAVEFNIEGNPFPHFVEMVTKVRPHQCTLVPDTPEALTSDHGWDLGHDADRLRPIIEELRSAGIRISLFMDADSPHLSLAKEIGADRIELYTEPYAQAYGGPQEATVFEQFRNAARTAQEGGLGVNAGHDLNLYNLGRFCTISGIAEVSIGHALISDALEMGLFNAVRAYLSAIGW